MAEISNTTLAVLVFAALVVVIAGTALNFMSIGNGLTGYATSDTGNVSLSVSSTLAIQVSPSFNNIYFSACTPRPGNSYWCNTNDTIACDGTVSAQNCTGDNVTVGAQYLRVDNVGNVNATVNVTSECTPSQFIGGTSPSFAFLTGGCNGTAQTTFTNLTTTGAGLPACSDVSYLGGEMRMYAYVQIPQDATGGTGSCADGKATLTFSALSAP